MAPAGIRLTAVTLSAPDPARLARFYSRLLGWPISLEEPDYVVVPDPGGGVGLAFELEDNHVHPIWPARPGGQQMQLHLEFVVDDLQRGLSHALHCGATMAEYQAHHHMRVCLDPAGHPFCIKVES